MSATALRVSTLKEVPSISMRGGPNKKRESTDMRYLRCARLYVKIIRNATLSGKYEVGCMNWLLERVDYTIEKLTCQVYFTS